VNLLLLHFIPINSLIIYIHLYFDRLILSDTKYRTMYLNSNNASYNEVTVLNDDDLRPHSDGETTSRLASSSVVVLVF